MNGDGGNRGRVALVIGSGGVKCAAAIGIYRALQREGIGLDLLVGCSGGAICAALMALGFDAPALAEMSSRLWTADVTAKHNPRALLSVALPQVFGFNERFGLVDDRLLNQRLAASLGDRTFAGTVIPLFITATDFHNGAQVVLSAGRLADAVRASVSMPYVFPAHQLGDQLLVDGYLSDPLPVGVAMREGADVILAIGFESPYLTRLTSLLRYAFQVSAAMANNLLKANFAFHSMAHYSEVLLVLPQFREHIGLFDTQKIPGIIEDGEAAIMEQMAYLKSLVGQKSAAGEPPSATGT